MRHLACHGAIREDELSYEPPPPQRDAAMMQHGKKHGAECWAATASPKAQGRPKEGPMGVAVVLHAVPLQRVKRSVHLVAFRPSPPFAW